MRTTKELPEEVVDKILSLLASLSPKDACKIAPVSTVFRPAVDSDSIWEKFLPEDYDHFISQSRNFPVETLRSMSKKKLYLHLCDNPIEIGDGNLQFSLDKPTGKKCLLIKAERFEPLYRGLIGHMHILMPNPKEAWVNHPHEFGYQAFVEARALSRRTSYVLYFLFKLNTDRVHRREGTVLSLCVSFEGNRNDSYTGVLLAEFHPQRDLRTALKDKEDGLKEVAIGEFFSEASSIMCLVEDSSCVHTDTYGITFEGIEVRPKVHQAIATVDREN